MEDKKKKTRLKLLMKNCNCIYSIDVQLFAALRIESLSLLALHTWLDAVAAAALLFLFHLLMYSMGISIWISCTSSADDRSPKLGLAAAPPAVRLDPHGPPTPAPPAAKRCCCCAMGVSSASSLYYKLSTSCDCRRCEGVFEFK